MQCFINMLIEVYSDGSSHAKSGFAGGWACVILKDQEPIKLKSGNHPNTSNNLMELEGAIQGLKYVLDNGLHLKAAVYLISDSKYCLGMAEGLFSPSKNKEKVDELRALIIATGAKTRWVAGHNGDKWNEVADYVSRKAKEEISPKD